MNANKSSSLSSSYFKAFYFFLLHFKYVCIFHFPPGIGNQDQVALVITSILPYNSLVSVLNIVIVSLARKVTQASSFILTS